MSLRARSEETGFHSTEMEYLEPTGAEFLYCWGRGPARAWLRATGHHSVTRRCVT